jgi:predicted alpha-1,2-mannosidase
MNYKNIQSFFRGLLFLWLLSLPSAVLHAQHRAPQKVLWQIGTADQSDAEFALAPSRYLDFLEKDFGWEDGYFLIGISNPKTDWPYALPGPEDAWGGTAPNAGLHSSELNILFTIAELPPHANWELVITLLDMSSEKPPLFKVKLNDKAWEYQLPKGSGDSTLKDVIKGQAGHIIRIPIDPALLRKGGNEISLKSLWGSWLVFDQVRMEGPASAKIAVTPNTFVRNVKAADYQIKNDGVNSQPLLVDVQYISGRADLEVLLDKQKIFERSLDTGRYVFEAPMPAVTSAMESNYEIRLNGKSVESGKIKRSPKKLITPADYVDTKIGTAHSRWMIAPGPWMPFSMVKISPDNQNAGWQAGYDPIFESVGGFSHIHEWTMSGLSMMPVNGPLITNVGDQAKPSDGYRSAIDKQKEEAPLGYYKVLLTKYNIKAELTATTRCSFQRYTFPKEKISRVLVDFKTPAEYGYELQDVQVTKVSDHRIEGFSKQKAAGVWGKEIDQDYTIHFVMEFDKPISRVGAWNDEVVQNDIKQLKVKNPKKAGVFVEFNTSSGAPVQVRTGISYVSIENAAENLEQEISKPFGWSFDAVRKNNVGAWNDLLKRVDISSSDHREKVRFYTNMYRALCSRNTYSDVDGKWRDATNNVQQLKDKDALALGCDAFWNTFWNLNQFWNLVTPDWSSRWVKSQLAMYDANGWLAKGPAGMKYIPVMVAEHEIPLIVSAYQMGIRNYDVQKAFEAVRKMETTPAQKVGTGLAGYQDLEPFLKYKFVPYDKGRFSNTLEYAYDNWTVAQFAKSINKMDDYALFSDRGSWWKNAIDTVTGYARLRKSDGSWMQDFDPFRSGANQNYVEGNAWQLTYFVPQDVPALAKMIGVDTFVNRLKWGFEQSDKWRFNAPGDAYWDFPVVQGNQQSMHFAFLFNWVNHPWLTQKWSRAILDRYYGYGLSNAYLGDEDQGQMSAWFVMAAIGLFQTDGGCNANPVYEIASPLYKKVTIDLGQRFGRGKTFTITANNASRKNKYIQKASLNGKVLNSSIFPANELLKGGELILEMGPDPNVSWGLVNLTK